MPFTHLINPISCHLCGCRIFKARLPGRLVWTVKDGKVTPPAVDLILKKVSIHDLECFNCGNDFVRATTAPYGLPPAERGGIRLEWKDKHSQELEYDLQWLSCQTGPRRA